jgi:hypothetical protein
LYSKNEGFAVSGAQNDINSPMGNADPISRFKELELRSSYQNGPASCIALNWLNQFQQRTRKTARAGPFQR